MILDGIVELQVYAQMAWRNLCHQRKVAHS
jgi:hypothetical protein